jgi:hypothetical protein
MKTPYESPHLVLRGAVAALAALVAVLAIAMAVDTAVRLPLGPTATEGQVKVFETACGSPLAPATSPRPRPRP